MKTFKSKQIIIKTSLSPSEVEHLLRLYKGESYREKNKFIGTVANGRFILRYNFDYRNSFSPQLSGVITPDGDGSIVTVSVGLQKVIRALLTAFIAVFAVTTAENVVGVAQGNADLWPSLFMSVFLIAVFAIFLAVYKNSLKSSVTKLRKIIE